MATAYRFLNRILQPHRVAYGRLVGTYPPHLTRTMAEKVSGPMRSGAFRAMVLDYRRASFAHDAFQFGHFAERFSGLVPEGFPIAYVFAEPQAAHVVILTRALNRAGARTATFISHRPAIAWARERVEDRDGPASRAG